MKMNAKIRRTEMVNFRVSEEEFQTLQELQEKSEARSVSDYARSAVFASMKMPGNGIDLSVQVGSLNQRIGELSLTLTQIHSMVCASVPDKAVAATAMR
jgi:hypothetical protein